MSVGIRIFEINHNQLGAFFFRQLQHSQCLRHTLRLGEPGFLVVHVIVGGVLSFYGNVRANPVDVSRLDTLLLCGNPDRFSAIVGRIVAGFQVAHLVKFLALWVPEGIGYDTMVVGHQSRSNGVMVGEGLRRE